MVGVSLTLDGLDLVNNQGYPHHILSRHDTETKNSVSR